MRAALLGVLLIAVCGARAADAPRKLTVVSDINYPPYMFVGDGGSTVYLIAAGRGYDQAASILGTEFSGVLERDGWAPYRRFERAQHQSCLAHLLRRASELIADSVAGQRSLSSPVRRFVFEFSE